MRILKILGINGSLRFNSSSHIVMRELSNNLPNAKFMLYEGLADIPAFDGSETDPSSVAHFKGLIRDADALVICMPEYAFGIPGALKNALDWTVGSADIMNKPVALITASSHGEKGHEAMQHVLRALAARLTPETTLLIPFIRAKINKGVIIDTATLESIHQVARQLIYEADF